MKAGRDKPVILFDGVCNFCNKWVQFLIKHDPKKKFLLAPLQSEKGSQLLKEYNIDMSNLDSSILIADNKVYVKSSVAIHVSKKLGGLYPIVAILIIVPPFIRNFFYDIIAKNRYKWYGKKESCMIPRPEDQDRFL